MTVQIRPANKTEKAVNYDNIEFSVPVGTNAVAFSLIRQQQKFGAYKENRWYVELPDDFYFSVHRDLAVVWFEAVFENKSSTYSLKPANGNRRARFHWIRPIRGNHSLPTMRLEQLSLFDAVNEFFNKYLKLDPLYWQPDIFDWDSDWGYDR
tara:strand:+ start:3221 stop:3676 length:456 start_codon:yes stop_codon:yes gene_type:complete